MALTFMGSLSAGDTGGEVLAEHWLIPYKTLGKPRTQVLALGAMHVDPVHGGALGRCPSMAKAPRELIDMSTDPARPGAAPRFQSSAFSWRCPRSGPDGAQVPAMVGPRGHGWVHRHVWFLASASGRSEIPRPTGADPHALSADAITHDTIITERPVRRRGRGRALL